MGRAEVRLEQNSLEDVLNSRFFQTIPSLSRLTNLMNLGPKDESEEVYVPEVLIQFITLLVL